MVIVVGASLSTWYWVLKPAAENPPSTEPSLAAGDESTALATIDQLKNRLAFAERELAASAELVKEPGAAFRDCLDCPKMVIVPAGNFIMGSKAGMGERDELPAHTVSIDRDFAIGAYEVTFAEWSACVADGGCEHQPSDEGWGQGDPKIRAHLPVININWYDAQEYVAWLSKRTDRRYRLPSEAEWEYVARGGADTRYFWGDEAIGCRYANGADMTYKRVSEVSSQAVMKCDDGFAYTAPVGSFEPNGFGIYDTAGNVSEWVEDHKSDDYQKVPNDGSVHLDPGKDYNHRAIRGGDWSKRPESLRSANRLQSERMSRESVNGFRVVRDLRD
ncbi:MAG: formylglycine-generating enzyme family protein [Pseudomonadota bacterium]